MVCLVIFILSAVTYLLLVWSGGGIPLSEVVIALALATIMAVAAKSWSPYVVRLGALRPDRWVRFVVYLFGPFLVAMAKANIDVALRVITGKIRPGIVKVDIGLTNDISTTLLANSITLTPGTLTVDVDEEERALYIHWINVTNKTPAGPELYGPFEEWARRIAE
ncbi:Na+/H+ antiporter subunit E [Acetomicrobium sp. S15 = DSM 107314]|uniref:Na+/H+ antiporter subunit E n=1 Tax=Acetomicrobium sp. S15 = DSM 107314 TaxID=2529858 RepID=UPI003158DB06